MCDNELQQAAGEPDLPLWFRRPARGTKEMTQPCLLHLTCHLISLVLLHPSLRLRRPVRGTKETARRQIRQRWHQRDDGNLSDACHLSLVAGLHAALNKDYGIKEMMQPCIIYLHAISLVGQCVAGLRCHLFGCGAHLRGDGGELRRGHPPLFGQQRLRHLPQPEVIRATRRGVLLYLLRGLRDTTQSGVIRAVFRGIMLYVLRGLRHITPSEVIRATRQWISVYLLRGLFSTSDRSPAVAIYNTIRSD